MSTYVMVHGACGTAVVESSLARLRKGVRRRSQCSCTSLGFLLRDGESLLPVAQSDGTSLVLPNLVVSEDQTSSTIKPEAIREVLYADCSDEDVTLAGMLLAPEALAPAVTPIHITEKRFGRVPRVDIECLRDKVIPPPLQRQMYAKLPCQKVVSMNTDHSPFFSAPQKLTESLTALADVGAV